MDFFFFFFNSLEVTGNTCHNVESVIEIGIILDLSLSSPDSFSCQLDSDRAQEILAAFMPSVTTVCFFPYKDIVLIEYSEKQEFKKLY